MIPFRDVNFFAMKRLAKKAIHGSQGRKLTAPPLSIPHDLNDIPLRRFWQPKPAPEKPLVPSFVPLQPFWTMPGDLLRTPEEIKAIADGIGRTIWRLESIMTHGELAHTRKAASHALADVVHMILTTWPPSKHLAKRWQQLYEKNTDFAKRWEALGNRGRRLRSGPRVNSVDAKIHGFISRLNDYVTQDLCAVEFSLELYEMLKLHDSAEHDRLQSEFQARHGLGRRMQKFLAEGRQDYERLQSQAEAGNSASTLSAWYLPHMYSPAGAIRDSDLLNRECVRRFDEYWQRFIKPVFDWALPLWLDDMKDWKDAKGESLPKQPPSRWERLMKSALKHELAKKSIAA